MQPNGTPKDVSFLTSDLTDVTTGPRFRGGIDVIRRGRISGWVVNLTVPSASICLEIFIEGKSMGETATFLPRPDIASYVPNCTPGFIIDPQQWDLARLSEVINAICCIPPELVDAPCDIQFVLKEGQAILRAGDFGITRKNLLDDALAPALSKTLADLNIDTKSILQTVVPSLDTKYVSSADVQKAQLAGLLDRVRWLEEQRTRLRAKNATLSATSYPSLAVDNHLAGAQSMLFQRASARRQAFLPILEMSKDNLPDIQAYAADVGNDPRRLFAFVLQQIIENSSGATAEEKAHAAAIRDVFDPLFYLAENPKLKAENINPLLHYVTIGHREGCQPNPLFDRDYYLSQAGSLDQDPLLHYVRFGAARNLNPHPLLDGRFYRAQNPKVEAKPVNPLYHYQVFGGLERRDPSPLFDTAFYLNQVEQPDDIECPLEHYVLGKGPNPHPLFSADYFAKKANLIFEEAPLIAYLKRRDLQFACDSHPLLSLRHLITEGHIRSDDPRSPLEQYLAKSTERDIDPHPVFHSALYRYQIEVERDIKLTMPPAVHYLSAGFKDNTILPHLLFDPQFYQKVNKLEPGAPDLERYLAESDGSGLRCHELFDSGFYDAQRAKGPDGERITALEHWVRRREQGLLTDRRLRQPLDPVVFAFIDHALVGTDKFNPKFYRALYPEFAEQDDLALQIHFATFGELEGRLGSAQTLLHKAAIRMGDIPVGFFADEYVDLNPDLKDWQGKDMTCLVHYLEEGRRQNRKIGFWQLHLDHLALTVPDASSPLILTPASSRIDLCALVHVFYPDLWPELAAFIRNFTRASLDVFVNVSDTQWTPQLYRDLRERCPGGFIQLSPNRGRDIGGHMRLLDNIEIAYYEVFAFVHTKRSRHLGPEISAHWRRGLLSAFAANETIAAECIQRFHDDPMLGIIGAAAWRDHAMGKNQEHCDQLFERFGIDKENRRLEYVGGTMFLIRSAIVTRLYEGLRGVQWEDGTGRGPEFFLDGQLEHAIERVIPCLARQMGYRIEWR